MTDLDIINKFKNKKRIKYFIFEQIWPEEYKYLINRFNDSKSIKESLQRVLNNINEVPKCPICGNLCLFDNRLNRFYTATCCSKECISKNWVNKQHDFALNKYGVDNIFQAYEIKEKIKETSLKKYGTEHPFKNEQVKEKFKQTCLNKYGVEWFCFTEKNKMAVNSRESIEKGINTKKKKGNLNTSIVEDESYTLLIEKFNDVKRNYKSIEYPFNCDFYIPSINTYIECNYHWTHGGKPYNEQDKYSINLINTWKEKNTKYYNNAINTFTVRDVNKRNIAKENNLNYLEFFNIQDLKKWINNI